MQQQVPLPFDAVAAAALPGGGSIYFDLGLCFSVVSFTFFLFDSLLLAFLLDSVL